MWYQVAVDDTLLQGSPSTSFDQPMTSLMCAGHALQAQRGLFCYVDQLCRLYDLEIAGNLSEPSTPGLNICMTRIPPAFYSLSIFTLHKIPKDIQASNPLRSLLTADAPVPPTPPRVPLHPTWNSTTTTNPSNSDTSAATAIVFPTEALISDLSSVTRAKCCENEGGFAPAFLYKAQLDILFDTQESVAAWTTLVGERCFGGDWILVWADGSRFSEKVTGYGVTAGLTAFGTDSNDQQRVCFALEGSEFVAHACNGSTATTSMNVVCLTPPIVFKSVNQTDDATYDSQDSVCRSEGGKLLPRLTQANLKDLVYYYGKLTAWTTMVGEVCQGTDWSLVWPDETRADNETLNLPCGKPEFRWCEPGRALVSERIEVARTLKPEYRLGGISGLEKGLTSFANASGNVSEELRVCFIIEDSQSLVANPFQRTCQWRGPPTEALTARTPCVRLREVKPRPDGSVRAWTTMLYEVAPKLIGWSRKEVWHDGESVSVSKIDIPVVKSSEKYEVEKTFCFVFRNTSMLVTQECFDNRTLMSALCVFV
ncbi:hypothetical protein C7M84_019045 [Penaeus vannamei]|uniref:C-type lectin domain-containing protein n=1 Tax=Penaeus vannamei TaxID=6689 RepID=A0A3R7P7G6_PENVA|nr:hypothetical protein C7M84_019045 [Penaeus vannamei]